LGVKNDGREMTTPASGLTPRKSVADWSRVERKSEVISGTVMVFVEGMGSRGAGVAAPEATRLLVGWVEVGVGVGGGMRTSTV
jgi:hypothetical protein